MLALAAALLTMLLPDTYNRPLPATVEEIAGWSLTKYENDSGSAKARESETKKDMTVSTVSPAKPRQHGNARTEEDAGTNMADSRYTCDEMSNSCIGSGNIDGDSMKHAPASVVQYATRL